MSDNIESRNFYYDAFARIKRKMPEVTESSIAEFQKRNNVSIAVVMIMAEEGALEVSVSYIGMPTIVYASEAKIERLKREGTEEYGSFVVYINPQEGDRDV